MTLEQALKTMFLDVSDLCLHSVKQQYYRLARKVHPDKGGSNEMMQNLTKAKEFLENYLASAPSTQPAPPPGPPPVSPTPSPSPSPLQIADARELALKFKVHLELFGDKSSSAWKLLPMMRDAANSKLFGVLMNFAQRCVELLAAENERWIHENGRQPSWEAIGFKRLSFDGYDVQGLRIIDYGNKEYEAILELFALHRPKLWMALIRLQKSWPTLDLWEKTPSPAATERKADVVEMIMGALRGNTFFEPVWRQVIDETGCRLPELFVEFVRICKLVQYLDALLCTSYLKHKMERINQLHVLSSICIKQLGFCCEWCGEEVTEPYPRARARKGLLLYALLNSATFARPNDRMYSVCL